MSDDKTKTADGDRTRINLSEDYEVQDWSRKFGVTPAELRAAVKKVGDRASDVEHALRAEPMR